MTEYVDCANVIRDRIVALIPKHPEILQMTDAWQMMTLTDFRYRDLEPSFMQMSWALREAIKEHNSERNT